MAAAAGPAICKKATDLRRHMCGAHHKHRHWRCTQCNTDFCAKKDLARHCTGKAHTSTDMACTDDEMYCKLLQDVKAYEWEDAKFTVEALEVMNVAATTATQAQAPAVAVPVAVATAQ